MLILKTLLSLIGGFVGLMISGIASAVLLVSIFGVDEYDKSFNSHPKGILAFCSIIIYSFGFILSLLYSWHKSGVLIKDFILSQGTYCDSTYIEKGGVRTSEISATWPFASLAIDYNELNLKVFSSTTRVKKEQISSIKVCNGIISRGIEIVTLNGVQFIFFSFDVNRLQTQLSDLGYIFKNEK